MEEKCKKTKDMGERSWW